jgi:hypothetical protein
MNERLCGITGIAVLALLLNAPASLAGVVARDALASLVGVVHETASPGHVTGTVRNNGPREVSDIVLLVRHTWVWPYTGHDRPDTYAWSDYVRVGQPLDPGATAAFASNARLPAVLPANARYFNTVEVTGATEWRRVPRRP